MADDVTLASLLATGDPAPADNSMVTLEPDPSPPPADPATPSWQADAAALQQRIAELEQLSQRHAQNITGSREEVRRYQDLLAREQETNKALLAQQQQLMERLSQPAAPAGPRLSAREVIEKVALGEAVPEDQIRAAMLPLVTPPTPTTPTGQTPVTLEAVQALLQQERQRAQVQAALLQDLGSRHSDVLTPETLPQVVHKYNELAQNPLVQMLYPPDPQGLSTIDVHGQRWDARLLDRAATELRIQRQAQGLHQQGAAHAAQALPASPGGPATSRPAPARDAVALPAGALELLKTPAIAKAYESLTGHKDPRTHAKTVFEKVPADVRAAWQRQAALSRPEVERT